MPTELKSSGIEGQSGIILPLNLKYSDLPITLRTQIEGIIEKRKRLGLPDDSRERKLLAVRNFKKCLNNHQ